MPTDTRDMAAALARATKEARDYRAVARNLAQILEGAADFCEEEGYEDKIFWRTAYKRQCQAHGVTP